MYEVKCKFCGEWFKLTDEQWEYAQESPDDCHCPECGSNNIELE